MALGDSLLDRVRERAQPEEERRKAEQRKSAASSTSVVAASSTSRPFARWAIAEPITITTASCQARRRLRASERESQIKAMPKASATIRAAVGTPGGRTPFTTSNRFANSGVSDEATPMQPTTAAAAPSSDSALGIRRLTRSG